MYICMYIYICTCVFLLSQPRYRLTDLSEESVNAFFEAVPSSLGFLVDSQVGSLLWIAAQRLKFNYHNSKTRLFTIHTCSGILA